MPPRTTKDILGKTRRVRRDKKRKNHYFIKTLLSVVLGLAFGFSLMVFIDSVQVPKIVFTYSGETELAFRVGDEYVNNTTASANVDGSNQTSNVHVKYYNQYFVEIEAIDMNVAGTYYVGYCLDYEKYSSVLYQKVTVSEVGPINDFSIHFLELGNGYYGDCIYIKAGETDVLIDAGSKASITDTSSIDTIIPYVKQYCTDGILEYVVATNSRTQHIACFASTAATEEIESTKGVFESFECKTIIDFCRSNSSSNVYLGYKEALQKELDETKGSVHYTALQCYSGENGAKRSYELASGITMNILYNYFYDNASNDECNNSVCLLFKVGDRKVLLSGDLNETGESYLVSNNPEISDVDVFKANYSSYTDSNSANFLNYIKPKMVAISCVAGTNEFSKISSNQYPTQTFITRIKEFTEDVYVTSVSLDGTPNTVGSYNGNIVFTSLGGKEFTVNCSNNNIKLKDSDWFKENRTW